MIKVLFFLIVLLIINVETEAYIQNRFPSVRSIKLIILKLVFKVWYCRNKRLSASKIWIFTGRNIKEYSLRMWENNLYCAWNSSSRKVYQFPVLILQSNIFFSCYLLDPPFGCYLEADDSEKSFPFCCPQIKCFPNLY